MAVPAATGVATELNKTALETTGITAVLFNGIKSIVGCRVKNRYSCSQWNTCEP